MARRNANKRKRRNANEGILSSDRETKSAEIDPDNNYMMRLPSELLIEILGYIIRQGDTIEMREGKPTRELRKWDAEAEKLKDPMWKKPKPPLMARNFTVCKELYRCGVRAFWGGNTFSFTTLGDLQQFIDVATMRTKESVKSIALFQDYGISFIQSLAPPGIPAPGPWPQWPPSLSLLSALPKVEAVDICTTFINQRKALPTVLDNLYGSESKDNPAHVRHLASPPKMPEGLYTRDLLLKTIPPSTLEQLKSLTVRYNTRIERTGFHARPDDPIVSQAFSVLAFARDLQTGRLDVMPYPNVTVDKDPEHFHINRLWLEGRAAVHFDETIKPAQNPWRDNKLDQWCTWSLEWALRWRSDDDNVARDAWWTARDRGLVFFSSPPEPVPRSFDMLFEDGEQGHQVREEHSWMNWLEDHPVEKEGYRGRTAKTAIEIDDDR